MDAKEYERAIMREVVDPFVRDTERALMTAERDYETLRRSFPRIGDYDHDTGARLVAGDYLNRLQARHRARFHRQMGRWMGVDLTGFLRSQDIRPLMEARIANNVSLIRTIPARYHDGLGKRLERHLFGGQAFDQQAMRQMLTAEYGSTGYNVRRIARDQTNKTIGELNRIRQKGVGVEEYEWRSSGDHRVRESHVELDGTIQNWEVPTFEGFPGDAVQCRCVAIPVIGS